MRSTFNVLFYIKRNEPKKDGRVVIMVRITINGIRYFFSGFGRFYILLKTTDLVLQTRLVAFDFGTTK